MASPSSSFSTPSFAQLSSQSTFALLECSASGYTAPCLDEAIRGRSDNVSDRVLVRLDGRRSGTLATTVLDYWEKLEGGIPSLSDLRKDIQAAVKGKDTLVVVDDLTPLLLSEGFPPVARLLSSLAGAGCSILAAVLGDCHDRADLDRLLGLARTSIRIWQGEEGIVSRTVHRPAAAGKATTVKELLKLDGATGRVSGAKVTIGQGAPSGGKQAGEDRDEAIAKLTTFSLGLTEKEKLARENLDLPFYKAEQRAAGGDADGEEGEVRINPRRGSEPAGGKIYYSPEDVDDWDEEDPDDDLDF